MSQLHKLLEQATDENGVCLLCGGTGRYVSEHPPGALGIGHRYEGPCSCTREQRAALAAGSEEGKT
jgi:hypothetical protein